MQNALPADNHQDGVRGTEAADPQSGASLWLGRGIAFLVLSVVFYRTAQSYADPDIWGHVRFGLDMLASGQLVPLRDPYSYLNSGHDWIDNEWLADLTVGWLFQWFGTPALVLLKVSIAVVSTGLLYARLCRAGFSSMWGGFLLLPASYLMLLGFTGVRMMQFTHLFFVMLLLILAAIEANRRWLWVLPPLFAVWGNLHTGILAGVGCAGAWVGAHLLERVWRDGVRAALFQAPGREYWLVGSAILLANLANPYGLQLVVFNVRDGFAQRPENIEFTPIRILSFEGLTYLLLLAVSVAGWIYTSRPRSLPLLAVFACTVLTPLVAVRHTPLFAVAAVALAGPHLADIWQRWQRQRMAAPPQPWLTAVPFLGGVALIALAVPHFYCIKIDPVVGTAYPVRAVALLKDSGVKGRLVVFFDWGEYVLWHVGPDIQVSLDPRRHSAYPDAVYQQNFQFQNGVGNWDALLAEGPPDMVLFSRRFPAFNLMQAKADWTLVYEDELAGLFVRRDSPLRRPLSATKVRAELPADGAGMCFP